MAVGTKIAFPNLAGQQFMSLTTFRKSGAGVATPVWFVDTGERLIVTTEPQTGKVKRIRRDGRVSVAPCRFNGKVLGPAAEGQARLLAEDDAEGAMQAFRAKYGLPFRLVTGLERLRGGMTRTFIEIRPAAEEPEAGR